MRKGASHAAEARQRMSEASKAALADPAVRQRMSEARKAAWADPAKGPKHLRGLNSEQREIYRLYRRKGFSAPEAVEIAANWKAAA